MNVNSRTIIPRRLENLGKNPNPNVKNKRRALFKIAALAVAALLALSGCGITGGGGNTDKKRESDIRAELNNPIYKTFQSYEFSEMLKKCEIGGEYEVYSKSPEEIDEYINELSKSIIEVILYDYNTQFTANYTSDNTSIVDISLNVTDANNRMIQFVLNSNGRTLLVNYPLKNYKAEDLDTILNSDLPHVKLKLVAFIREIAHYGLINQPISDLKLDFEASRPTLEKIADKLSRETGYNIDPNKFYLVRVSSNSPRLGYSSGNLTTQFPISLESTNENDKIQITGLIDNEYNSIYPKSDFIRYSNNYIPLNEYFETQTYLTDAKTSVVNP